MTRVLFVISSAKVWTLSDGTEHPTGYWAEEVAEPFRIFTEAGWEIVVATPDGKAPTMDELSMGLAGGTPGKRKEIKAYLDSIADRLDHPAALADVTETDFDLVFYPGGHGPMEDLAFDATSGQLLSRRVADGRPVALLCHAPAATLAAKNPDGDSPFAGYSMTGLSNVEERTNPFAWKAKWYLQDAMEELGVDYSKALLPFRPHVVVDRNVYTGQNPQASTELAERLVADLG